MLTIKSKDWKKFINALAKINNAAAKEIEGLVGKGGLDNMDLISLMGQVYRVTSTYGEAAAALTCEMYDAIAVAQNAKVPPAEPARPITMQEVRDTVNYALSRSPQMIPAETGKLVKKMSTRTMRKNAARDGAKMALVPSGDGCAFCKMLGSRGWESARASKSFEAHLHSHCRCEYVVRFNGDLRVEGYDPDALYDEFMSLEGDTWEEKLNSMRRAQYAVNKDAINAQKREAYAVRKVLENVANGGRNGIIKIESEPDFYAGTGNKVLESKYAEWIGENQYQKLMQNAVGEESKKYIRTAYRRSSIIGDGGTVAVREFEKATGLNLGRNGRNHEKKVEDLINQVKKSLTKPIQDSERKYLEQELKKLEEVKGK